MPQRSTIYRVAEQCEHHGAEAHHPDVRPSQILSFNAHTETVVPLCYLHTSAQVFAYIEHRPRWYCNSGVEPGDYTTRNRIASEMGDVTSAMQSVRFPRRPG